MHRFRYPLAAAALCLAAASARADWVLPAGSTADLGGGTASLGCVDLLDSGTLALSGGSVVTVQDVTVSAGAQLQIGSGQIELAQQWDNQGGASTTTGRVTRVASAGCPLVGAAGPVSLRSEPSAPTPVPATGPAALGLLALALALLGRRRLLRLHRRVA
ncbi:MAG: hypothetical protein ACN6O3_05730 [Comamonas sp.]